MIHSSPIDTIVEKHAPAFITLSDHIWERPELRFHETESAAAQITMLRDRGFAIREKLAGIPTAFCGEWGESGPIIAFLGEFDALAGLSQVAGIAEKRPIEEGGNGHGCGHNLLGSGAMLAAVALRDHLREHKLPGRVRYYGCPAEEGGSGKTFMARAGVFDGIDAAFSWHPGAFNGVFPSRSLANIQVYFRFHGRAAHAAACPELGRSALDALELTSIGVQYMREHMPMQARIHSAITKTGGISPNVVQDHAEVLYLIRSPELAGVHDLFRRVKLIAQGAALMTETTMSFEVDKACSNLMPNRVLDDIMHHELERLGTAPFDNEDRAFARAIQTSLSAQDMAGSYGMYGAPMPESPEGIPPLGVSVLPLPAEGVLLPGSTDVGDVSRKAPLTQCFSACHAIGTPMHSWQLVAQGKSGIAHRGMVFAAKAMAGSALSLISDPQRLNAAKAEFARRSMADPYICPIPEDVVPSIVRQASS